MAKVRFFLSDKPLGVHYHILASILVWTERVRVTEVHRVAVLGSKGIVGQSRVCGRRRRFAGRRGHFCIAVWIGLGRR
jgi:hypothetical protein